MEVTKQKSKETLQHAILFERERVREMQWDLEELRKKCFQIESKLKSQQVCFHVSFSFYMSDKFTGKP